MFNNPIHNTEDLKEVIHYVKNHPDKSNAAVEQLASRCIQKAQEFKDLDLEFSARLVFLDIVNRRHKPDVMISMFPWLLKRCDEDMQRFRYNEVLSAYSWILTSVKQFASVPKAKIDALWDDFARRVIDFGGGQRSLFKKKFYHYSEMGEIALAEEQLKLYHEAKIDGNYYHCNQCHEIFISAFLMEQRRFEELLEVIDPVLREEITCHLVGRYNFHMGMIANMMLGNWEEAERCSIKSRKKLDLDIALLFPFSSHLIYYGIAGQFAKGRTIFEKQYPHALQNAPDLPKLEFLQGARVFFFKLQQSGRKKVKLTLPENKVLFEASSNYSVDKIIDVLSNQIQQISEAFDRRNGNDYYCNQVEETLEVYGKVVKPQLP